MVSDNEVKISEQDLATLLRAKVNTITNLELQVTTLSRIVVEKDGKIEELEGKLNDTGEDNAKSGEEKISILK
jgi:peptidoglycan hydrolase CwlO-like protein|tara:strand:- start:1549 stop:1767 length:219 start_codon:yes stop_codon:yes gene_type:complete